MEVLAPIAHYDVAVEMSCKASLPGRRDNETMVETCQNPSQYHPFPTLAHAPAIDILTASIQLRMSATSLLERLHNLRCGQKTIVKAIVTWTRLENRLMISAVRMDCLGSGPTAWTRPASSARTWADGQWHLLTGHRSAGTTNAKRKRCVSWAVRQCAR